MFEFWETPWGIYGFGSRPLGAIPIPARSPTSLVLLVAGLGLLALAPAEAHSLVDLSLEVPASCPDGEQRCLKTSDHQPRLQAGEEVHVYVYNDDDETHELHVALAETADPDRSDTPLEDALVSSGEVAPGGSADAGDLSIPRDADGLYVWCSVEGHEAEGEHLSHELAPADDEGGAETVPGPAGVLVVGILASVAAVRSRS